MSEPMDKPTADDILEASEWCSMAPKGKLMEALIEVDANYRAANRQLKAERAANREKDAEIARLKEAFRECAEENDQAWDEANKKGHELASLRASGGEKERADRAEALLQVASEEHDRTRILRGWPVLNNIGRWEIELDMKKYRESFNVAPPTLTREKE